jgi:TRAP-type C4-dicarboxylate transport system permease small subunit
VIFRYGVQHSLPWADETAAYLFIWLVMLGAASEVWGEGHPAIHVVVDRVGPRLRAAITLIANVAVATWGAILLVYGIKDLIIEAPESMSSLPGVSLQIPYAAIPVAGALIVIFALSKAVIRR